MGFEGGLKALERDRAHGARWTFERALDVLEEVVREKGHGTERLKNDLAAIARRMAASKPMMAPLHHLETLLAHQPDGRSASEVLQAIRVQAQKEWECAVTQGAAMIKPGSKILTCSFSDTIVEVLSRAQRRRRRITVSVMESKVGRHRYGCSMVRALSGKGVEVTLVPDRHLALRLPKCTLVLLGADAILKDGWVVNGTPSKRLAELARGLCPVYVIGERFKHHPGATSRTIKKGKGFDLIPPSWIAGVVPD